MDMRIILVEHPIDESLFEEVGEALATGSIVAFPTETVYGLGASALPSRFDSRDLSLERQTGRQSADRPPFCLTRSWTASSLLFRMLFTFCTKLFLRVL